MDIPQIKTWLIDLQKVICTSCTGLTNHNLCKKCDVYILTNKILQELERK